jgi:pyridoxamine 5'-phosphate oxidase family protein
MTFTAAERVFLGEARLGRIATTSADHVPDVAPVGFSVDGDDILVGGMDITKTLKYHNIRATGTGSFVVDDLASVDPWRPRGVKVTGAAVIEDGGRRPRIRITPDTVWSWGINQDAQKRFGPIEKRSA